jgi:hypothetical protein
MKKFSSILETSLVKKIKELIKEQEVEEVVITPSQYYDLLKAVFYKAQAIPRLARFKGKKIVINGSLDLSKFRDQKFLTDLGPIKVIGDINIAYTNIKSLDNVEVTGHSYYYQSPFESVMARRRQKQKENEQEAKRENNDWDINDTDEIGEKANAAFEYAIQQGELETLDDADKERIDEIKLEIQELEEQQENLDGADEDFEEEWDSIEERIDSLNEEMDELTNDKVDVYDLYYNGSHWHLTSFESLSNNHQYAVGTISEADRSVEDYYEDMVDEPTNYFDENYLSYYIDEEEVKDSFRDSVEEWIRDSPDDYGVEMELSSDQEEEIWLLEMEKWVYENEGVRAPISEQTREDGNVFDFEDAEGNRFQYKNTSTDPHRSNWVLYKDGQVVPPHQIYDDEDTEDHESERESRISDIEYEIEDIKESPDGDPDEDSLNDAVESYLDDEIGGDAYRWLKNMGYRINDYVDKNRLKEDLINDSNYGDALNGYDGSYDLIFINGTEYIVMRID